MLAESILPFTMEGWQARNGGVPYQGSLVNSSGKTVSASVSSDGVSHIQSYGLTNR